ncbi:MAG: hypothetical protein ACRC0A_00875, partial [Chitinophagaceae bacterium]
KIMINQLIDKLKSKRWDFISNIDKENIDIIENEIYLLMEIRDNKTLSTEDESLIKRLINKYNLELSNE